MVSSKKKRAWGYYITGIVITILFLIPFIWMIFLSFKDNFGIFSQPFSLPETWDFSLYVETYKQASLGNLFLNSLQITVISVAIAMTIVYISSYSIARLIHRGEKWNNFIYLVFLAGTAVPVFAQMMTLYEMTVNISDTVPLLGIGSLWSLLMPYIAIQVPSLTMILVGGLKSVPLALEEAAIMDGASLFQVMFKIVLPTIKPVFMTALVLNFLGVWNEYTIASILLTGKETYTIPLATSLFKINYTADYGAMLRAATILLIPQVTFFMIFQKNIMEGMATSGLKG